MENKQPENPTTLSKVILILLAAAILELCLGTFYAWSIFVKPLMQAHGWDKMQTLLPMTLNAVMTGLAAFLIGAKADRSPRPVAFLSGLCWGLGLLGASYAVNHGNSTMLNWTFGILGGTGVGLGYITGIAVPLKWLPQRRGLVSGIVILAFGGGGMIIAKLGPAWMKVLGSNGQGDIFLSKCSPTIIKMFGETGPGAFLFYMGIISLVVCCLAALFLKNPPGYKPKPAPASLKQLLPVEVISSGKFWAIWIMVFINVYAGFAILSNAAPMGKELMNFTETQAGTMLMFILLGNGLGRIFWSAISDKFGAKPILALMFITTAAVFFSLFHIKNPYMFGFVCSYVAFCYGGIFGTMPAFCAEIFGPTQMGRFYGPVLTAISAGVVFVLYFFTGLLKEYGYPTPFMIIGCTLIIATILPFVVGKQKVDNQES